MTNLKKYGASLIGLALTAGVATAGPADDAKKVKELEKAVVDQGIYVETAKKGIKLSGYVNANYTYNFNGGGTDNGVNGSPGTIKGHAWGTDSQDFSVAQVKVALEKGLGDQNTWSAGFRIDLLFGEDSKYLGDNDSGMENIEQAYVQFRVPIGNGLDFKFGKFVTLLGYEVIETPANLNVTRGFVFNSLPLTHTGILMSYKFNDMWDAQFGLVNGWNNSDSNFIGARGEYHEDLDTDGTSTYSRSSTDWAKALLARVGFNAGAFSGALSGIYSIDGDNGFGQAESYEGVDSQKENAPILVLDLWLQWKPTEQLLVALDAVWGKAWDTEQTTNHWIKNSNGYYSHGGEHGYDGKDPKNSDQWWGVAVYTKYQFNKVFSLAGRAEYFHTEDGRALGIYDSYDNTKDNAYSEGFGSISQDWGRQQTHSDFYSFTLTAGFDVWENLLMRLEYRLDVVSAAGPDYKYYENSDGSKSTTRNLEDNYFTNNHTYQSTVVFDVSYSF